MFQCRNIRICEHRDPPCVWDCLDQNVLSLAIKVRRHQADTSNIATWLGQRGGKSSSDHILGHCNDRYGLGRFPKLLCNKISCAHNRIWCSLDYCWYGCGCLRIIELKAARYELEIPAFNKALNAQFIKEGQ